MRRIVYAPNHGSNRRRRPSKRRCRGCHMPATHAEVEQRPRSVLHLDGSITRDIEDVSVYWCVDHSGLPHEGGTVMGAQAIADRRSASGVRKVRPWRCSDRDAIYCPIHHDCTCVRVTTVPPLPPCPLHGAGSTHPSELLVVR